MAEVEVVRKAPIKKTNEETEQKQEKTFFIIGVR